MVSFQAQDRTDQAMLSELASLWHMSLEIIGSKENDSSQYYAKAPTKPTWNMNRETADYMEEGRIRRENERADAGRFDAGLQLLDGHSDG